jgi:diguanylate cyclase (GGDEF)-like protein
MVSRQFARRKPSRHKDDQTRLQAEQEQRVLAEALCNVAAVLNSSLELDQVLDRILFNVGNVVPHDAANIMLVENEICRVVRTHGYRERGLEEAVKSLIFNLPEVPNLVRMATSGAPLAISDTSTYPGWVHFPVTSWVYSYASAPIVKNGQIMGFLNLDSASRGFYNQEHAERLMAFANQAAVAIYNAKLYEKVQQLAITDELTGLYNRRGLYQFGHHEIERAIRFKHPLSIIMLDIDKFKIFNDSYSYQVGDEVLHMLAERCLANVREVDIVTRYGGDEFVILLVENDLVAASQITERLKDAIERNPFSTSQGGLTVRVSIGATTFTPDMADLSTLIEKAGQALHLAKQERHHKISII